MAVFSSGPASTYNTRLRSPSNPHLSLWEEPDNFRANVLEEEACCQNLRIRSALKQDKLSFHGAFGRGNA